MYDRCNRVSSPSLASHQSFDNRTFMVDAHSPDCRVIQFIYLYSILFYSIYGEHTETALIISGIGRERPLIAPEQDNLNRQIKDNTVYG